MNKKTLRKYELVSEIMTSSENAMEKLRELCDIDFQTAFDMWEYKIGISNGLVVSGFDFFQSISEQKTRTAIVESIPAQKAIYSSTEATDPKLIEYLGNFVIANKLDIAEECLSKLRTNPHFDFNEILPEIINTIFAISCKKNNSRVPVLNKKQKMLLTDYINKIKGPNKALLLQRMKEI